MACQVSMITPEMLLHMRLPSNFKPCSVHCKSPDVSAFARHDVTRSCQRIRVWQLTCKQLTLRFTAF